MKRSAPEIKFYDTSKKNASLAIGQDATGGELNQSSTICLTTMPQGVGECDRLGRTATVTNVHVNGVVRIFSTSSTSAIDNQPIVFLALVLDKQTNGVQLKSEDVFVNQGTDNSLAACPFINLVNRDRFEILDSVQFEMQIYTAAYTGSSVTLMAGITAMFHLEYDGEIPIEYDGTTETIANSTSNSVQIVGWTSSNSGDPQVFYNARTRFVG